MHAVSTNQITDFLHFHDNQFYMECPYIESSLILSSLYVGQYLL